MCGHGIMATHNHLHIVKKSMVDYGSLIVGPKIGDGRGVIIVLPKTNHVIMRHNHHVAHQTTGTGMVMSTDSLVVMLIQGQLIEVVVKIGVAVVGTTAGNNSASEW